ncbi:MAG TPA: hypothetical protein VGY57_16800 [Vicinamibacterales bacterium]|nr:hypothetical protein [Vicinamibacterales bacterium]
MKIAIAAAACLLAARVASAQPKPQFVGPSECINCHDHQDERTWYERKEMPEVVRLFPDRGDKAGHINSLKQLDNPKGDAWAVAIGQKDKYDPNGVCVRCHATVFAGDANAGVSCESCHGPASLYLKPHQTKDSYETSVTQYGMTRLVGNLRGWTQQCTNCHVMDDERLIKAGHPAGDDFELGKKFLPVSLHFKKKYADADVAGIAKDEMEGILKRRGRVTSASAIATAPAGSQPATVAPAAPEAPPPPPPETSAGGASGSAAPRPPRVTRPPVPRPTRPRSIDPPAGSPTSIEPPPPIPDSATSAAASASSPAATPAAADAAPEPSSSDWQSKAMWAGGGAALALVIGLVIVFLVRRSG